MPDNLYLAMHAKPFVRETLGSKSLHFTFGETQSQMRLQDPELLVLEYTRMMMGFLLFDVPLDSIAMIGLGGGSIAKFCYRHLPQSRIHVVEINPHVIALREAFQVPQDNGRFQVVHGDGAQFVRGHTTRHDVLLVDGFVSHGLPLRLCSQDFYDDCRATLSPGGMLVVNLDCNHPHFKNHVARLRHSFNDSVLVVDNGAMSNSIAFACAAPETFSRVEPGLVPVPMGIDDTGANQLFGAFALIASALKTQWPLRFAGAARCPRSPRPASGCAAASA
jgi:spermidine synthase